MHYIMVIIAFNFGTFEFIVTDDFIVRKSIVENPKFKTLIKDKAKVLDQRACVYYTVPIDSNYRMESPAKFYDTGWQSDQSETTKIEVRPVVEGEWTCYDIIETSQSSIHNPFGSGNESKKITRICKIPELEHLIQDEQYYKFLNFYRTDIDLPFKGIAIKQWLDDPENLAIDKDKLIISRLSEIRVVEGIPVEIEQILNLPIREQ